MEAALQHGKFQYLHRAKLAVVKIKVLEQDRCGSPAVVSVMSSTHPVNISVCMFCCYASYESALKAHCPSTTMCLK